MEKLIKKIENKTAKIGVIGLGYVGLPLALVFAEKFNVIGYDINDKVVNSLQRKKSPIKYIKSATLKKCINNSFFPTSDYKKLKVCDFFIISVPTPLTLEREPDLSFIKNTCETIVKMLRKKHFVILESTTFPGTTQEIVVPILEKSGLTAGLDFGVAYSPERIDPGSKKYVIKNTPKVVGGINTMCTEIAAKLYSTVINEDIIRVNDCKTAEATKLFENIFREVNIALVNELALVYEKMGIDIWEVINAASTKPFGFMPFYPGPGIGGHCIPLDPFYLSYKAKKFGMVPRFIELSWEVNEFMKTHTVNLVTKGLKEVEKKIYGSKIAVMGLAYKKDIEDTRESPSKKIIEELHALGAQVKVYDPYADHIETNCGKFVSENCIEDALSGVDCAVFVTNHSKFNIEIEKSIKLARHPIIIDCRNIFKNINRDIIYHGIGKPKSP